MFDQEDLRSGGIVPRIRLGIALICCGLLLAMMGLTMADVIGRYMLNAPVPGATELTELLLAAVIFVGLPAASLDRDHIAVDIATSRLTGMLSHLLSRTVGVFSAAALGVIAWRLWKMGDQIAGYSGTTPTLKLPIAPVAYGVACLCAVAALVTLAQTIRPGGARDG